MNSVKKQEYIIDLVDRSIYMHGHNHVYNYEDRANDRLKINS